MLPLPLGVAPRGARYFEYIPNCSECEAGMMSHRRVDPSSQQQQQQQADVHVGYHVQYSLHFCLWLSS